MASDPPVVIVYAVWHPGSSRGADYQRAMYTTLCADPDVPASRALGLKLLFRTSSAAGEVPIPVPFDRAQHTVVFVLADEHLVADPAWRSYVEDLVESARPADRVISVATIDPKYLPPSLRQLQAIRLKDVPDAQWETTLLNEVMHDICRILDPGMAKVRVFLSHAKEDGLPITTAVRRHLHEVARLDEFFDAADIPDGTRFAEFVTEAAGTLPALLAIQTDSYASREWCRLEVLEAKRRRVPIVVLSAVNASETRSFPYIGNTPVVRWSGETSLPLVVRALLGEVLRTRYFPRRVAAICQRHGIDPSRQVFSYPPELVTMLTYRADMADMAAAGADRGNYLYPDPPLGTVELKLLRELDPDINPVTPTILQAL